ncbi:MAG: CsbD family protein [Pseudomonadota bacterium]
MNRDRIQGDWHQVRDKVKAQWASLTDEDLDQIDGKRENLLGRIQERHGYSRDEAERHFNEWHDRNPTGFFERY